MSKSVFIVGGARTPMTQHVGALKDVSAIDLAASASRAALDRTGVEPAWVDHVIFGNVQPSVVPKKDGTLVAYMRDNGPPPKRLLVSESQDGGKTWGPVRDSDIPNPGSGAEVIALRNGQTTTTVDGQDAVLVFP